MKSNETLARFVAEATDARLDLTHLEPWPAWKLFKHFVLHEIEDAYETASFQFGRFDDDPADPYLATFFIWQFTRRQWGGRREGGDELVGRLVIEFRYPLRAHSTLRAKAVWAMDFPTPAEWASVVEGLPQFQESMSHEPLRTLVFYDKGE